MKLIARAVARKKDRVEPEVNIVYRCVLELERAWRQQKVWHYQKTQTRELKEGDKMLLLLPTDNV